LEKSKENAWEYGQIERKCLGIWTNREKMLGNMEKSKENAGEHGKIERKCWGIWKNVRNMLENMGIKRKSKIYAPNNAGSSLVSQRYMQVIPKNKILFQR